MEFTARIGFEIIHKVFNSEQVETKRKNIEERLSVFGFSAGGHNSAFFCRYVYRFMNVKPGLLIGEYIYLN